MTRGGSLRRRPTGYRLVRYLVFLYRLGPADARAALFSILTYKTLGLVGPLRRRGAPRRVVFHPHAPGPWQVLYKVTHLLGLATSTDLSAAAAAVVSYEDVTHKEIPVELAAVARTRRVINVGVTDISKDHVERVFTSVFERSTFVDPSVHVGTCAVKTDENGRHDGEIVACPTARRPGYVYQRVIDNREGESVVDIRAPIVDFVIPFVYLKYRPLASRFGNENARVVMRETGEVLRPEEVAQLLEFSARLGLDYGELDVLRDANDRLLYVIDANSTPTGPPNGLPRRHRLTALLRLSRAFNTQFLQPSPHSAAR